ncbi:AI-2E family transporter [Nesterenkonia lutea]|uniref:PurR-regulated permease PerM n=1 Tax=Nesterenkonia lutea TaxID=272919 RepID=A0ABR9JDT2_9MICC|nr:AI-2E family transporter [Nesterenkonia lutea]MBE1523647.1 putative PurR-regulated permease PerM [Nesterenkonia lutea]
MRDSEQDPQPRARLRGLVRRYRLPRLGRTSGRPARRAPRRPAPELDQYGLPPVATGTMEKAASYASRPIYTGFMLALGVGLALLVFYVAQANAQLLVWIAAALFIAIGLDPVVRSLERAGVPRPAGVLITLTVFLGLVATVIADLAPMVAEQTSTFLGSLPGLVDDILGSEWFERVEDDFEVQEIINTEVNRFLSDPGNLTNALGGLYGVGTAILTTGLGALVVFVLAIYFLASLPVMTAWGYRLVPRSSRERVQHLGDRILDGVGHYVMGQAFVAVLNGIVAFIAISIAGVPFGVLFAVVAGVLAFIPLVGPVTGGTLVTLVGLTVDWQTAATFAAIYFVYLQVEAYLVSPRIMARAVRIPAAVVVISVIAGGTLLGVLGALMAIPTAAAVMLLTREVLIRRQDAR